MRLQEYDIEIQHVKGSTQVVADGLSRLPHWLAKPFSEDPFTLAEMCVMSAQRATLQQYHILLRNGLTAPVRWKQGIFQRYLSDGWYKDLVRKLLWRPDEEGTRRFSLACVEGVGISALLSTEAKVLGHAGQSCTHAFFEHH